MLPCLGEADKRKSAILLVAHGEAGIRTANYHPRDRPDPSIYLGCWRGWSDTCERAGKKKKRKEEGPPFEMRKGGSEMLVCAGRRGDISLIGRGALPDWEGGKSAKPG